jgi:hypothetical protein
MRRKDLYWRRQQMVCLKNIAPICAVRFLRGAVKRCWRAEEVVIYLSAFSSYLFILFLEVDFGSAVGVLLCFLRLLRILLRRALRGWLAADKKQPTM